MTPNILPSPNHDPRPDGMPIDTLVLHYTGMKSARAALERLCDPASQVSAHYVVEEDGTVWRLVEEECRAFHAGVSFWRGHAALNGRSIGVEIVNPGHEWGYRPFPPDQMRAVATLCQGIIARHPIPPRNVVAHSDIAPDRKQDPGELFDWKFLARHGIGLWPDHANNTGGEAQTLLAAIGYDTRRQGCTAAFQRHWHPTRTDGIADPETIARMAAVLDAATR